MRRKKRSRKAPAAVDPRRSQTNPEGQESGAAEIEALDRSGTASRGSGKPKDTGGRPSKYPEAEKEAGFLRQVELLAGFGLTQKEISIVIGISETTLKTWKDKPEFKEALEAGKTKADLKVINSLFRKAVGYEIPGKNAGDPTIAIPGDTVAMIFWLKNRRADQWREKAQVDVPGLPGVEKALYELSEKFLPAPRKAKTRGDGKK